MSAPGQVGSITRRDSTTPWLRHLSHFVCLAALTLVGFVLALRAGSAPGPLLVVYAAVVALNVLQIALSSWSSALGFLVVLFRGAVRRPLGPVIAPPNGRARTAVLMPIYEENAGRVFATVAVTVEGVETARAAGATLGKVDYFILSDTRSEAGAAAEDRMASSLAATHPGSAPSIFYRRRVDNEGRKAGNVAEWFEKWGGAYDYALVLDADSLMSGEAIARLVGVMDANPNAGIVQAMCYPIGLSTLYARAQQFRARFYGPLFQIGVAFWQGPRGNYWGHNAILRTAAFAAHCGLPVLDGSAPFGGSFLSHDTVEAALMLRGGWDVWMLPEGPNGTSDGSWEQTPTNLLDNLDRDRRWCNGNLQHVAVLRARGLRIASIYHLTRGLMHYLYILPLMAWMILYALLHDSFSRSGQGWLAAFVIGLLFLPTVLGVIAALRERAGFGGSLRLVASAGLESVLGWLSYPIQAVCHSTFLFGALTGHMPRWDAQLRDDRDLRWREAGRALAVPVGIGLAFLAVVSWPAPDLALLFGPGLVAAIPFAVWSSRVSLGRVARRGGLFLTPDEVTEPAAWRALGAAEAVLLAETRSALPAALPPLLGLPLVIQVLRPRPARASAVIEDSPSLLN